MAWQALILSTLETKTEETEFLQECLLSRDVESIVIDTSLKSVGHLSGSDKIAAIRASAVKATSLAEKHRDNVQVIIGIGGGTGGEIALSVFHSLPMNFPKILVTPLPFDPRREVSDTSIVIIPTIVDILGLNPTLRIIFENVAAMTAGLCRSQSPQHRYCTEKTIGISALGVTSDAAAALVKELKKIGQECTVFHANGFGGAAFARFVRQNGFKAIVDLTPHELTRIHIGGDFAPMPGRFDEGGDVPRIVLPGALNFITLAKTAEMPSELKSRKQYQHSENFTHIALSDEEMRRVAGELFSTLNEFTGKRTLVIPLKGFSSEDRPGGAIFNPEQKALFHQLACEQLKPEVRILALEAHISEALTVQTILDVLIDYLSIGKETL